MVERRCRYCERIFQPSKYQLGQSVCSERECQRRRRADYHRQKIAADPEYRLVCRDSPQKWRSRNPDYWRRYREEHPEAVERNRQRQHVRDQKRRLRDLANNNSAFDLKRSAAEVWLLGLRTTESCKQQLSSSASLDSGSTSSPQTTAVGILQTTTSWRPGGFCRITEFGMLTTDQINDLHRLYWSERWPIRKIERHLRMGWRTIKKYLD